MAYDRLAVSPEFNGSLPLIRRFYRSTSVKWSAHTVFTGNYLGLHEICYSKSNNGTDVNSKIVRMMAKIGFTVRWRDVDFLLGPNELCSLYEPDKYFEPETAKLFITSWFSKDADYVTKVATAHHNKLITHGGLTHGLWTELGKPQKAEEAAELLNERFRGKLFFKRSVALGGIPNYSADPVFAHPFLEFYPSWLTSEDPMPFGQITATKGFSTFEGHEYLQSQQSPLYYLTSYAKKRWGSIAVINGAEVSSVFTTSGFYSDSKLNMSESFYTEAFHVKGTKRNDTDDYVIPQNKGLPEEITEAIKKKGERQGRFSNETD